MPDYDLGSGARWEIGRIRKVVEPEGGRNMVWVGNIGLVLPLDDNGALFDAIREFCSWDSNTSGERAALWAIFGRTRHRPPFSPGAMRSILREIINIAETMPTTLIRACRYTLGELQDQVVERPTNDSIMAQAARRAAAAPFAPLDEEARDAAARGFPSFNGPETWRVGRIEKVRERHLVIHGAEDTQLHLTLPLDAGQVRMLDQELSRCSPMTDEERPIMNQILRTRPPTTTATSNYMQQAEAAQRMANSRIYSNYAGMENRAVIGAVLVRVPMQADDCQHALDEIRTWETVLTYDEMTAFQTILRSNTPMTPNTVVSVLEAELAERRWTEAGGLGAEEDEETIAVGFRIRTTGDGGCIIGSITLPTPITADGCAMARTEIASWPMPPNRRELTVLQSVLRMESSIDTGEVLDVLETEREARRQVAQGAGSRIVRHRQRTRLRVGEVNVDYPMTATGCDAVRHAMRGWPDPATRQELAVLQEALDKDVPITPGHEMDDLIYEARLRRARMEAATGDPNVADVDPTVRATPNFMPNLNQTLNRARTREQEQAFRNEYLGEAWNNRLGTELWREGRVAAYTRVAPDGHGNIVALLVGDDVFEGSGSLRTIDMRKDNNGRRLIGELTHWNPPPTPVELMCIAGCIGDWGQTLWDQLRMLAREAAPAVEQPHVTQQLIRARRVQIQPPTEET